MTRAWLAALAFLFFCSCGGGGGAPPPSVKSNDEEVQGKREEIKSAADAPPESESEVLRLLKAMEDPDAEVRWRAEFALGRVGPQGIQSLASALKNERPKIRLNAAAVLGPQGRKGKDAIPALLEALSDSDAGVRVWAAHALGGIDTRDSRVVPALTQSLRDPSPDVRRVILTVLLRLGPDASGASTALVDLLQDADAGIRAMTCRVYSQIGPDGKVGIPALITRLSDPDADVRDRAAQALAKIGPDGVPPLARALRDRDPQTRRGAALVLGSFGAEGRSAAAELADAAKDSDPSVQKQAAEAIRRIQNDQGDAQSVRGSSFIEAPETLHRRQAGYKWAKLGLFIHWGLYAVTARAKPGQVVEALMENDRMPLREYEHLAVRFGAEKWKPEDWAKLANEMGARYLVLSAKDRDGFCLWNSKLTDFTATRAASARRDLLGELAAACEKEGVKVCASYSLMDWHHPDFRDNFPKYVDYLHGQVKELLTGYPLWGLWFDGEIGHTMDEWRGVDLVTLIRQTKPSAFINDRLGTGTRGLMSGVDFYTEEPGLSAASLRLQGRPTAWELSQALGDSSGYTESLDPLKSGERLILDLVEAASKGGNLLVSVGARPDGTIPDAFQARLRVLGAWLQKNGDSVYDTERSPFGGPIPAGRVTAKGTRLYVFLEELPKGGIITLPGLKTKIREAWVQDGKRELRVRDTGVQAPDLVEGSPVTVVGIELEGPPEVTR